MKKTITLLAAAAMLPAVYAEGSLTETTVTPITVPLNLPGTGSLAANKTDIATGFTAVTDLSTALTATTRTAEKFGTNWLGGMTSKIASDTWYIGAGNKSTVNANKENGGVPIYQGQNNAGGFDVTARGGYQGSYNACALELGDLVALNPDNHYFHITFDTQGSTSNTFAIFGWNGSSYVNLLSENTGTNGQTVNYEVNVVSYEQVVVIWGADGGGTTTYVKHLSATLVPEPATATLSLLALAGLAARRRRK